MASGAGLMRQEPLTMPQPQAVQDRRAVSEMRTLTLKAALGCGVPLGHAEELSAAVPWFMGWDGAFFQLIRALSAPITPMAVHETEGRSLIFEGAQAVMAGPMAIDAALSGVDEVVLKDLDCEPVFLGLLLSVQYFEPIRFQIEPLKRGLRLSMKAGRQPIPPGPPLPLDHSVLDQLQIWAERRLVPDSAQSRAMGAGEVLQAAQ